MAYWLGFRPEKTAGAFYDLLWLSSRTFCGVFPAAREQRRGYNTESQVVRRRKDDLPTGIIYDRFPYIAYEYPVRQTRQSPRASVEALQNYLAFGGGLASCDNERLLVLSPRAAGYDLAERIGRVVHVYNPTNVPQETRLSVHHLPASRQYEVILGNKRVAKDVAGDALKDIAVRVAPRRVGVVEVAPSRQTSTHF
ncbi:hypothetical protein AMJ85_05230 [candidate division BRC1 bacterium SM23_51]|nr:MAG: hypothetical protein AMJ85_05230 [candidate division BRC1 bacterium SM23_51]